MCTSGSIGSSQEKESTQAVSISATNDPANGASSSSSMATKHVQIERERQLPAQRRKAKGSREGLYRCFAECSP